MTYPNQNIDIAIPHSSRDLIIVPGSVKIKINIDIDFTEKARTIAENVGRALVKKKVVMIGSKEINTINNADIYETYKDLYLSEEEREEKLLHGIKSANGLRSRNSAKRPIKKGNNSYDPRKCD